MVPPTTVRLTPLRLEGSERLPIGRQLETNLLSRASQPTATMTVHLTRAAPPAVARRLRNGRQMVTLLRLNQAMMRSLRLKASLGQKKPRSSPRFFTNPSSGSTDCGRDHSSANDSSSGLSSASTASPASAATSRIESLIRPRWSTSSTLT